MTTLYPNCCDAEFYHHNRDKDDAASYRRIGFVHGDFEPEIARLDGSWEQILRRGRKQPTGDNCVAPMRWESERELVEGAAPIETFVQRKHLDRLYLGRQSVLHKVAEALGVNTIKKHKVRVHRQMPGQMFRYHIDGFTKIARATGGKSIATDDPEHLAVRFFVALRPWQIGHMYWIGTHQWKWELGEIIHYESRRVPHGTVNLGATPRYTLQISGLASDKTRAILASDDQISIQI